VLSDKKKTQDKENVEQFNSDEKKNVDGNSSIYLSQGKYCRRKKTA
jgi:hypothetical protein